MGYTSWKCGESASLDPCDWMFVSVAVQGADPGSGAVRGATYRDTESWLERVVFFILGKLTLNYAVSFHVF